MTVSDYAESRKVTTQTVRSAIKRYPELNGHVSTEGKKFILDAFAVDFLDKNLRLPSTVIDDGLALAFKEREIDLREQLMQAQQAKFEEMAITRQDTLEEVRNIKQDVLNEIRQLQTAQYDDTNVLDAIGNLEKTVSMLQAELEEKNRTINELNARLKEMTDKYMEEASKSAWKKMFGK